MPLDLLVSQFGDTKARIDAITADLRRAAEADETARRLQTTPGIGPITASDIVRLSGEEATCVSPHEVEQTIGSPQAACFKAKCPLSQKRINDIAKQGWAETVNFGNWLSACAPDLGTSARIVPLIRGRCLSHRNADISLTVR
jgi:hypothetical protein